MPHSVLIADDDCFVRVLLRDILAEADLALLEAADGREALDLLAREQPELVLLDLLMPNVSGLEILDRLPKLSPRTRALVISSMDTEGLMGRALEAGARGFIAKPFHPFEITAAVRDVLET